MRVPARNWMACWDEGAGSLSGDDVSATGGEWVWAPSSALALGFSTGPKDPSGKRIDFSDRNVSSVWK